MAELRTAYSAQAIRPFYVGATPAVFSHTGAILATPFEDDVVITDLITSKTLHTLEGEETITALALTPDGNTLAVVSQPQQLRIYNAKTGELLKTHRFSAPVYIASADNTSSLFAFGATDGVVTVWDVEGGYVTHTLKGHGTTICSLKFHGQLHLLRWVLASGDTMGTCKVWDLVLRKCISTVQDHLGAVRGLGFSDLGDLLITGGRDEVVNIYEVERLRRAVKTFSVRHGVEACGFFPGLAVFYTAGAGNCVKTWDSESGAPLGGSPDPLDTSEHLVAVDVVAVDDFLRLWMVLSDQTLTEMERAPDGGRNFGGVHELSHAAHTDSADLTVIRTVAGNHGTIADMRFVGPNHDMLALATNAPALRLVDPQNAVDVVLLEGHTDLLNCVDVSPNGQWLLTGSKDNVARLWRWDDDLATFTTFASFTGHAGAVTAVVLPKTAPDRPGYVITGLADLTIKKWAVPVGGGAVKSSEYTRRAHDKDINALAGSPNDEFFASASFDKTAKIWHTQTGETVGILKGHKRGLWDVSFCEFDKLVCTASGDKTVRVWSLSDYLCTATLEGHTNAVQRCRFMGRSRQIVSSGADGLVKVWDIKENQCVATLDNHETRIWALDTRDDGDTVVSADADGYITFWTDITEQQQLEEAEKAKARVEQEQSLSNYVSLKDWSNAFLLALTLDQPMRLYNVVKGAISENADADSAVGNSALEDTILNLGDDQMEVLVRRMRDWNVNFRHFELAQKVLGVVLRRLSMDSGTLRKMVDAMIPYNERHYARLGDLVEATYGLDYVLEQMN